MDRMDAAQAREHIEMVDRILAESQQRLCCGGEYFVVWGIVSAFITLLFQLVDQRAISVGALWSIPIVLLAGVGFSIVRGRSTRPVLARSSLLQREFFNVLWLTLGLASRRRRGGVSNLPGNRVRRDLERRCGDRTLLYRNARKPPRADRRRVGPRLARRRELRRAVDSGVRFGRGDARGLQRLRSERAARSRLREPF